MKYCEHSAQVNADAAGRKELVSASGVEAFAVSAGKEESA